MERRKAPEVLVCTLSRFKSKGFPSLNTIYNLRIIKPDDIKVNSIEKTFEFEIASEKVNNYENLYYYANPNLLDTIKSLNSWISEVSGS